MNVRLGTARTITVGPVLDADGVAKTDLAVAAILASKNGGAPGALDGSATLVHQQTGHYLLALTTSDISALGLMTLTIDSTTDAMAPVRLNILTAAAWDALHAASGGYIPSALQNILATALTETSAGYLSAAFKKLFDVATPVLTAASVDQTGDSFGLIGTAGASLTDLGGMSTGMKAEVNAEADTALTDYDGPTDTEMVAAFTEIKGATWSATDTLEAIRDRGDAEWITATSVTVSDKTGFKLASDGLAQVTAWTVAITGDITGNLSGTVGGIAGTTQTLDALQTALDLSHGAGSWLTGGGGGTTETTIQDDNYTFTNT